MRSFLHASWNSEHLDLTTVSKIQIHSLHEVSRDLASMSSFTHSCPLPLSRCSRLSIVYLRSSPLHSIMSSLKPLGRRRPSTESSSTEHSRSSSPRQREHTRKRLRRLFTGIRFYVVLAKLSEEFIGDLIENIEKNGGETTSDPEQSDIIITVVSMKARLLRHVRWELAVCARWPLEPLELH